MHAAVYQAIAISLGLGLLVGLQREWKESEIAGIRTFPLITMLGTTTTLLSETAGAWVIPAGLLSVALMLLIGNLAKLQAGKFDPGLTTEVAALLMFGVGAIVAAGYTGPAVVTTGIVAVLLHWKKPLHGFVDRIGERDLRGVIHLVLIALVILPLLPDTTYGPYDVLNPYRIWWMVVLIVGISMAAYVAYKLVGPRVGAVLGGILGGLISSTATTVSYARQTKASPDAAAMAALVIIIASTIVNVRVLFEIAVVAPELLRVALAPILILMALMALECLVLYFPLRKVAPAPPDQDNPAQLLPALIFGALYAVVLFIVAVAKEEFGDSALYVVAIISGLTDMDAITLSTAKLFNDGRLQASVAWRVILVGAMSNLVFKAGAVALLGSRRLLLYVTILFGIALAGSGVLLQFWPDVEISIPAEFLPR